MDEMDAQAQREVLAALADAARAQALDTVTVRLDVLRRILAPLRGELRLASLLLRADNAALLARSYIEVGQSDAKIILEKLPPGFPDARFPDGLWPNGSVTQELGRALRIGQGESGTAAAAYIDPAALSRRMVQYAKEVSVLADALTGPDLTPSHKAHALVEAMLTDALALGAPSREVCLPGLTASRAVAA